MSIDWPEIPETQPTASGREFMLAQYEAQLQDVVNRRNAQYTQADALRARESTQLDQMVASEERLREAVHAAYLDVAKSTLERMLRRADMIITVSAGAATVYTALLGLAYSSDAEPLPVVAVVPALFLAFGLVLSAFYAGYVSRGVRQGMPLATGTSTRIQHQRLNEFVAWVNSTALDRGWALRSAVLSLFVGIAAMPVAFIGAHQGWILAGVLGLAVIIRLVLAKYSRPQSGTVGPEPGGPDAAASKMRGN